MPRISSTTKSPFDEYSYDFPVPSNSSLTVPALPTRKPPQVLHRRRSPSPNHHAPHFPSHSAPKYSPSTRAAEVSRLLDPTYSNAHPQGSGSTSSTSPLSVFVDHYGDIHDPEYRHFPVVTPRPKWERGAHDDDLAEEDEDMFDNGNGKRALRVPAVTAYTPSYAYTYQCDAAVALPSSYASQTLHNETEESPFADETEKETARATKKHRRHSKPKHDEKRSLAAEDSAAEAAEPAAPGADYSPSEYGRDDWTPTCTQSIRREWQAITLRLRFSAFRTKRKIKRRLGTG